jgi:hypothetical protein
MLNIQFWWLEKIFSFLDIIFERKNLFKYLLIIKWNIFSGTRKNYENENESESEKWKMKIEKFYTFKEKEIIKLQMF